MNNRVVTSVLTIVCVLCGGWFSGAFAAPSVRALGGAGTYTGTTSAAAAKTGGATTVSSRAGSVRVAPVAKVSSLTTPRISNSSVGTSTSDDQRMSIGKYLGPSVTGGVKISGSGTTAEDPHKNWELQLDNALIEAKGYTDTALDVAKAYTDTAVGALVDQIGDFVGDDYLTKVEAEDTYQLKGDYVSTTNFGTLTGKYLTDNGYLTNTGLETLNANMTALGTRVGNVESVVASLGGDEDAPGSVKYISAEMAAGALAVAETYTDTLANGAVAGNTAAIAAINNAETGVLKQAKDYTDEAVAAVAAATSLPTEQLSDGQYYVWDTTGTAPQWRVISIEDTWSDGIPSGT